LKKKESAVSDLLAAAYPWTKALHIISVIAWMAGLFYLPRLFVYHAEQVSGGIVAAEELFRTMERRLLRAIMNPSMVASWIFGLALVLTPGVIDWGAPWVWVKGASILGMTVFHMWLGAARRDFAQGANRRSGRSYRIMNEVPTLLMVLIVVSVVVKY
jgi:putative membrane protein